jgi:hypothetical protein
MFGTPGTGVRARRSGRFRAILGLVLAAVIAVPVALIATPPTPAEAANASLFDPGFIISDAAFFDNGAMTTSQVQSFLNAKVPTCRATTGPACLKSYTEDTRAIAAADPSTCGALSAKTDQTSAQIITAISNACGISPRVLVVLLEKEQGLVSSSAPSTRNYTFATGWGCPDTADCQRLHTGLFNQLYKAAWQLKWYGNPGGSFTWIKVGQSNFIRYHPNASCGGTNVVIKNRATAALYYYTPYQPNAAALGNLYGVGNGCSAYGNRNFWRMYSDWFGSPIGGDSLFKTASSSTVYLVADDLKYKVGDAPALKDLDSLGKLNTVSQVYMDKFTTSGELKPMVKDSTTGKYYILDQGTKYPVPTCAHAHAFGFTCAGASKVTTSQIARMDTGSDLGTRVTDSRGHSFYFADGVKHEYYDGPTLVASGFPVGKLLHFSYRTIAHVPAGAPILPELKAVTDGDRKSITVSSSGKGYTMPAKQFDELKLSAAFGEPKELERASVAATPEGGSIGELVKGATSGDVSVLTPAGRIPLVGASGAAASTVPDALATQVPVADGDWAAPYLARIPDGRVWLVDDGVASRLLTPADTPAVMQAFALDEPVDLPVEAIRALPHGPYVATPGTIVKATNGSLWFIDGADARWRVTANGADELTDRAPVKVSDSTLAAYAPASSTALRIGVTCDSKAYVGSNGTFHPLAAGLQAKYPFAFTALTAETCALVKTSAAPAGRFFRDAVSKQFYYVWGFEKRPISSATYRTLRETMPPDYLAVSPNFLKHFPTGSANSL